MARDEAVLVPETLAMLKARGEAMLPALAGMETTAIYAGLRPATEFKDYQIRAHNEINLITVGGIRSTGLSSALGIARHVFDLYRDQGNTCAALMDPVWPTVPPLCEYVERSWQGSSNGGIVCHCERVTRAEISAALEGPLAPASFAGLKRKTRVTMGRCQGFYCSAELAHLTRGRLKYPMGGTPR